MQSGNVEQMSSTHQCLLCCATSELLGITASAALTTRGKAAYILFSEVRRVVLKPYWFYGWDYGTVNSADEQT